MKIETPILKRLGPIPFWRGETKCLEGLETMYRKAKDRAQTILSNGLGERPTKRPRVFT